MFQVMLEVDEEWAADESHRVTGNFDCEIAVSPIIAKRRAGAYLAINVTMMTLAGTPKLVIGKRPMWHCTVYFNYPGLGEIGTLGTLRIDAQSGEVIPLSEQEISSLQHRANVIATSLSEQTRTLPRNRAA